MTVVQGQFVTRRDSSDKEIRMALGSVAPVRKAANVRGSNHSFADAPAISGTEHTQASHLDYVPEYPKLRNQFL